MMIAPPAPDLGPRRAPITDLTPETAIALGFSPIPLRASGDRKAPRPEEWQRRDFEPDDWRPGESVGLRTGRQRDGTYLYFADYDHKPERGVDAPTYYAAALARLSEPTRCRVFTCYSTGYQGRYIAIRAKQEIRSGWLRDADGRKIGDFLGIDRQVVAPTRDRCPASGTSTARRGSHAAPWRRACR